MREVGIQKGTLVNLAQFERKSPPKKLSNIRVFGLRKQYLSFQKRHCLPEANGKSIRNKPCFIEGKQT